jgi:iron complex transport system substrate-binding protein
VSPRTPNVSRGFLVALFLTLALAAASSAQGRAQDVRRPRIVSLMPSLTEDLFAIGAGAQVIGVSQFTDYPPAAAKLPQVASFSSLDAERIVRLHPDLIVGIPSQAALTADLRRAGLRTILISDDGYDDIFADLAALGRLSGHVSEAAALAARLRARTARLMRSVPHGARPRAFVVVGVEPIFTVGEGSYIAHLLGLAGARNAARNVRQAYARYSAEALLALQPDVIIADKASGLSAVLEQPPWNALRAVKAGRVYVTDDDALLERPGPRYNDGLAWLIAKIHPNLLRKSGTHK